MLTLHILTWRVHYCFSLQSNHDKTGKLKLRDTLQSPIEVPGLEPRAHTISTLVRRGIESHRYGGVSLSEGTCTCLSADWTDSSLLRTHHFSALCGWNPHISVWGLSPKCEDSSVCNVGQRIPSHHSYLALNRWPERSRCINIPLSSFPIGQRFGGTKVTLGTCSSIGFQSSSVGLGPHYPLAAYW